MRLYYQAIMDQLPNTDQNQEHQDLIIQLRSQANAFLKEAASLQEKAEVLFNSAAILEEKRRSQKPTGFAGFTSRPATPAVPPKAQRADRGTRLLQVKTALRFGPLTRGELLKATRIPKGTLDHLLKPGGHFEADEEGRFHIKKRPEVTALGEAASAISQQNILEEGKS